ncbi:MAG: hypothetical protein IPM46_06650 [Flavobacteriales bacterium]|nr:hypothetical protein [Flavobacteriales bacterium]MBK9176011.1 hypothetical protein [Flavobacteriales bacterium]
MQRLILITMLAMFTGSGMAQSPDRENDLCWIQHDGNGVMIVRTDSAERRIELQGKDPLALRGLHVGQVMQLVKDYESQGWTLFDFEVMASGPYGIWILRKPKQ